VNVLLDTHTFLWSKSNDPRMSASAWSILRDPANQLFLSSISAAEMAIKHAIGKLSLATPLPAFLAEGMRNAQVAEVPLRITHTHRLLTLPLLHRDPFDRLLIATALEEDMTLLTDDQEIRQYPVKFVW